MLSGRECLESRMDQQDQQRQEYTAYRSTPGRKWGWRRRWALLHQFRPCISGSYVKLFRWLELESKKPPYQHQNQEALDHAHRSVLDSTWVSGFVTHTMTSQTYFDSQQLKNTRENGSLYHHCLNFQCKYYHDFLFVCLEQDYGTMNSASLEKPIFPILTGRKECCRAGWLFLHAVQKYLLYGKEFQSLCKS